MLGADFYQAYNFDMKIILWSIILVFLIGGSAFAAADDSSELLRFSAVNAGYKDGASAQNFDFIELYRPQTEEPHALANYRIVYTNSSGNFAGEFTFNEYAFLAEEYLVLGYKGSPQYQDSPETYLYNFSSSGLASTAGKLELYYFDELIDELCWGKITCAQQFPKFATSEGANSSILLLAEDENYYAEINPEAIMEIKPETPSPPSCAGVQITEIYSYYQEDSSEQFIELHNPTAADILLDYCRLNYKKRYFALDGTLPPGQYLAFQDDDLLLTKNPTKDIVISILDADDNLVTSASYGKKQKRGVSYAWFNDGWRQSYAITPGAVNIFQEFQSCEEGKIINPATGNCIKAPVVSISECKEGYYRNPATGRCKKNPTMTELTPCKDGYERNPETNRCRKIVTTTGQEYAIEQSAESESHQNSQTFIAITAIVATAIGATIYVIIQFRHELVMAGKKAKNWLRRHLLRKTV